MTEIDSNQFQLVVSKKTKKKLKQGLNAKFRGNTFKAEATTMKLNPELSDCVMKNIFSMLSLKDLVKTSALSRRWIHEWRLRMDLNFDLHNMFDYNTIQDMSETLILSQFTTKLDQFMLHYQGPVIRSIRVDFPLCKEHTHVVNRLISKGIAMGVQRIDLLFRYVDEYPLQRLLYKISLTLLSNTHSLTYLHLENCLLAEPVARDFSGLKNLKTIVLDGFVDTLNRDFLSRLFRECLQLEHAAFKNCYFLQSIEVTGPKLHHLEIFNCDWNRWASDSPRKIFVDALNLSSFEYSSSRSTRETREISIVAPRLYKVFWDAAVTERNPFSKIAIAKLTHIESLAMIITPSQVEIITEMLIRFQNLKRLELFIKGAYDRNKDFFWILDIAMASQYLQEVSLTIKNPRMRHSHMAGVKKQKREYAGFSHNNLKYAKFSGCVCSVNVIELASNLLRNASSLKEMTFNARDKFYIGSDRWTNDSNGCGGFEQNDIHEMLKDEVNEQCQLIIL